MADNKNDKFIGVAKVIAGIVAFFYFYVPIIFYILYADRYIVALPDFVNYRVFKWLMDWFLKTYNKHQPFADFVLFCELFFYFIIAWAILFYILKLLFTAVG